MLLLEIVLKGCLCRCVLVRCTLCSTLDEDGMLPVHCAASTGQLDSLKVGRAQDCQPGFHNWCPILFCAQHTISPFFLEFCNRCRNNVTVL